MEFCLSLGLLASVDAIAIKGLTRTLYSTSTLSVVLRSGPKKRVIDPVETNNYREICIYLFRVWERTKSKRGRWTLLQESLDRTTTELKES